MRRTSLVCVAVLVSLSSPAFAQEWIEFVSRDDGFRVNFPSTPTVTTTTYTSEYGASLPARVYSATQRGQKYSMTVVDYRPIERLLTEKSKQCPPFADERCTGFGAGAIVGSGYWKTDIRGALVWASWQIMQRQGHALHVELHRPRRRPPAAAHQQLGQIAHVRGDLHAR